MSGSPTPANLESLLDRAVAAFADRFGRSPAWAAWAPGRVNLIGEHTDYNLGFVLPIAIDRWCVCAGAPASGPQSRIVALDVGETAECSLAELSKAGPASAGALPEWARYLAGAIVERAAGLGLAEVPELDIVATSTVPVGGGLSSSAAIETSAAALLEASIGRTATDNGFRLTRARDCQRAEHRWAGVPCGLMDQLASSFGREGHALRIDCRDDTIEPVPMPGLEEAVVLVVQSGVRHSLAAGEYAKRRAACEAAAAVLGTGSLREAGADAASDPRLSEEQTRCVRHVVGENARVERAAAALRDGDLKTVGELMLASHASLRDDYRVSCPELDAIVEIASGVPGVFGARMTGGGFGGCAVVLATPAGAEAARERLPSEYRRRTGRECEFWTVSAVAGAAARPL